MKKKSVSCWNFLSGILILFQLILLVYPFPFVMDDWYHAAVIRAFYEKNGVVFWDFWEFAPFGRPHLYPPLFHAVGVVLAKVVFYGSDAASAVLNSMLLLKGVSFAFLLFSVWMLGRLFSDKTAFFAVLFASQSAALLISSVIMLPSAFALALLNLLLYFFWKRNLLASVILLTLIAYTHLGVFSLSLLAILLLSSYGKKYCFGVVTTVSALILYAPWLVHLINNLGWFRAASVPTGFSMPLLLAGLAAVGIHKMFKRDRRGFMFLVIYIAALLPALLGYGNRFWGYALIPLSIFAAYAVSESKWTKLYGVVMLALIAVSFFYAPTVHSKDSIISYFVPGGQDSIFVPSSFNLELGQLSRLDSPLSAEERLLIAWVSNNTEPSEVIVADGFSADIIFAGTGRRATGGSWQETAPLEFREKVRRYQEKKEWIMINKVCPQKTVEVKKIGRLSVCKQG